MRVRLILSGSLRALVQDQPREVTVEADGPARLKDLLVRAGINPLVVIGVVINGRPAERDCLIENDAEIELYGPPAGG